MFERAKTLYNRWTSCRFCQYAKAALSWAWNLRFLPDSARRWVFGTGTRALQIVNIGFLLVWAWVFGVNGFGTLPLWTGINQITALVCGVAAVAVSAAIGLVGVEQ